MSRDLTTTFGAWRPLAVVFDCDGLLVDTEPSWTIAETEIFARRDLAYGAEIKARLIGRHMADVAQAMAEIFDEPGNETQIEREILSTATRVILNAATAMPGAHQIVTRIASLVPVAVASNSPRKLLNATLDRAGLREMLPISVAGNEISSPKPDPEIYETACRLIATNPGDVLAFEDSPTGTRSAIDAGLRVIGVPTLDGQVLSADCVVGSLLDETLLNWIDGWTRDEP